MICSELCLVPKNDRAQEGFDVSYKIKLQRKMSNSLRTPYGMIEDTSDLFYDPFHPKRLYLDKKLIHTPRRRHLQVLFYVEQVDHDGYCSGQDGSEYEKDVYFCYINRTCDYKSLDCKMFDYYLDGCTHESERCSEDFYTSYKALAYRHIIVPKSCSTKEMNDTLLQIKNSLSLYYPYGVDDIILQYFNCWVMRT